MCHVVAFTNAALLEAFSFQGFKNERLFGYLRKSQKLTSK